MICNGPKVEMGNLGRSRAAQDHNVASGKVGISRISPKSEDIGKCSSALELKLNYFNLDIIPENYFNRNPHIVKCLMYLFR